MCAFQFINKTPTSATLSRSEQSEQFLIRSHVQSRRRKRQKGLLIDNKTNSTTSGEDEVSSKHAFILRSKDLPFTTTQVSSRRSSRSGEVDHHKPENPQLVPILPHVQPSNNGFDPFHCTSVSIDAGTHAMLHYIFSYAAKVTFLGEAFAPKCIADNGAAFRHDRMITQRLKRCVDDKMLMYSTLAYGSSFQGWVLNRIEESRPPEIFLGKAIEAVRLHLGEPEPVVNTWLLLSMYALTITELWNVTLLPGRHDRQDELWKHGLEASEMHLKVLKGLIADIGGMNMIEPYVMESLILADKYLAMYRLSRPILPFTWDPGSTPSETLQALHARDMNTKVAGKSFELLCISRDLCAIISDIEDYAGIARSAWASSNLQEDDESWLFLRLQALFYRLLLFESSSELEESVRVATQLILLNTSRYRGAQLSARSFLSHLETTITKLQQEAVSVTRGLMFWLVSAGAMVEMACEERDWFLSKTKYVANALALEHTVSSYEQYLMPFLFLQEQRPGLGVMIRRVRDMDGCG